MKKKKYRCILMLVVLLVTVFIYIKAIDKREEDYKEVEELPVKETIFPENITSETPDKKQSTKSNNSITKKKTSKQEELLEYKDYTNQILKSISKELEDAQNYCEEMKALGDNQYSVTALAWYFKTFQNNGYMDIKNKKQWENKFINIPYPGEKGIFVFKGEKTTPEELGNILYGMIGRQMGFSPKLIYQGSGFAAGADKDLLKDATQYYGDSKEDYFSVKRGIAYIENNEWIEFDISQIPTKILNILKNFTKSD